MSAFDNAAVRDRFSSLRGDFVFLDAPGGTQTPDEVADAVARVYREASGNIGVPYATSQRIGAVVEAAREGTARFLGCDTGRDRVRRQHDLAQLRALPHPGRARCSPATRSWSPGSTTTPTWRPGSSWRTISGIVVRQVDVNPDTTLDVSDLERLLGPRTRVVAFPWASNAVGTTVDARAVCDLAHQAGALAWIDAVQYAPHEPIDVRAAGADVLLCSAYKFCGPHLGIAYGRREVLEAWRPYKARPAPMQPVGHRFETGTLPYELLGGLAAAFDFLDSLGPPEEIVAWERQLGERLLAGLPPGARLYGLPAMGARVPTFLINFPGVSSGALSARAGRPGLRRMERRQLLRAGTAGADRLGRGAAHRPGVLQLARRGGPAERGARSLVQAHAAARAGLMPADADRDRS